MVVSLLVFCVEQEKTEIALLQSESEIDALFDSFASEDADNAPVRGVW